MPVSRGLSIRVRGLRETQAALRRADSDAPKRMRAALRDIAEGVRSDARGNSPTGPRPKRASSPELASSLRVSARAGSVSVFSNAPHAAVQNWGGRVGHGAIIRRARASHYLSRAVAQNQARVERDMNALLDNLERIIS